MKFDNRAKLFLFALMVITPVFSLKAALDIALIPRFICWSLVLILGVFLCLKERPKTSYLTILDGCFLVYYLVSAASLIWAFNTAEAIFEMQKIFAVFLTYLLTRFLLSKSDGRLIPFLLLCNVGIAIIALCSTFWQMSESPTLFRLAYNNFYNITGLSAQKNLLCSFLYLTLIFNALAITYIEKKIWRIPIWGLMILQIFILLLLQTRAVYMAIIVSSAFFIIGFQVITHYFNIKRIIGFITILFILIGGLFARLYLVDDDFDVYLKKANITEYLTSPSALERINMWKKTSEMIQKQPFTGVGVGNWAIIYPSRGGWADSYASDKDIFYQRPHNDFLWVFSEIGFLGFVAYLGVFISAFITGFKAIKISTTAHERLRIWILLSGLVGYIVIANFSFPKERVEHQIWLALLLAVLVYYAKNKIKNTSRFSLKKIDTRLLILLALMGLCFNLVIGHYRYQGETAMRIVYRDSTPPQRKKQLLKQAESYFYKLDHVGFPMSWYAGIIANGESNRVEAIKYFTTAYHANPYNFKILNDLAAVHGAAQNYGQAKKYLNESHIINPKSQATIFNLTVLYYNLKDYKTASEWTNKLSDEYPRKAELLQRLQGKF